MSINMYKHRKSYKESGVVAIMVVLILMIIISLIVIGFAQISRRNSRQALDRQLSTQAFYAAETGINDATELIRDAVEAGSSIAEKSDCDPSSGGGDYSSLQTVLNAANKVEYTCLLVDPAPPILAYSNIGTTGTIIPLLASSGTINTIKLDWQAKSGGSTPLSNCPIAKTTVFSEVDDWLCGYGVLRFDLVPTAGSSLSIDGLRTTTMTSFVVPMSSGTGDTLPVGYATDGSRNLLGVVCTNQECSMTINGLGASQYYMRVSSLYKSVSLQVSATDGSGAPVNLQGTQAVVDVTGKAQDVLRRVQVRVPLISSSSNLLSDHAVQSTESLCKRFAIMDGLFDSDADAAVPGVGASTTNPLCQ